MIGSFALFFIVIKNQICKRDQIFIFLISSFFFLNVVIKTFFYDIDILVEIKNFLLVLNCITVFIIFSSIKINSIQKKIIFYCFNSISLIFATIYLANKFNILNDDFFLTNNKNTKNIFITIAIFFNFLFFKSFKEKLTRFSIIVIQIILISYIILMGNFYSQLIIFGIFFYNIFFVFLNNKLKKKIFYFIFILLTIFILFLLIESLRLNIDKSIYELGKGMYKYFSFFFDLGLRASCWEDELLSHDVDLIYKLHKKYPVLCYHIPEPYNNILWDIWLGMLIRSHYFLESAAYYQNYISYIVGHTDTKIIFSNIVSAHNSYMDYIIKFGIPSFISVLTYLILIFINMINNERFIQCLLFMSILFCMSFDDFFFGHRFSFTIIIWLSIGLASNLKLK